jgi:UDP-N-acetylmuramoylalanine--D-glutamate ligase
MNTDANIHPSLQKEPAIAIFGGGVSGKECLELVRALGGMAVIYDEKAGSGDHIHFTANHAQNHRLIVNSPGFPPHHPWFRIAAQAGCEVIGETEFASRYWPGKVIGITGTNGKSTLTRLLTEVFCEAGFRAHAFGNIGDPFSGHLRAQPGPADIAILELSSFQTWNLHRFRLDAVIWTNFAEDHLDWHGDLKSYFNAKWRAIECACDGPVILGESVIQQALAYGRPVPEKAEIICDRIRTKESGKLSLINEINLAYVAQLAAHWDIPVGTVRRVAEHFTYLPHRLTHVGSGLGLHFWNDSKATNFHAAEWALASFYEPVVWIGGGLSKGGDLAAFARRIAPKIRVAMVFGAVRNELADALIAARVPTYVAETLEEAMELVRYEAMQGENVLFAPAFASFDQFQGYADRGKRFCSIVEREFKESAHTTPLSRNP